MENNSCYYISPRTVLSLSETDFQILKDKLNRYQLFQYRIELLNND